MTNVLDLDGVSAPIGLRKACELANKAAYTVQHDRATCIVTSHALAAYLRMQEGYEPELVRITMSAFPAEGYAVVLGSPGDGTRRPAAGRGMWHGHLGVTCDGYLLDPTLDQVNSVHSNMSLPPVVLPLPPRWDDAQDWGDASIQFRDRHGTVGRYGKYRRQAGWKSAGDARPSHWQPIVRRMSDLAGEHPSWIQRAGGVS